MKTLSITRKIGGNLNFACVNRNIRDEAEKLEVERTNHTQKKWSKASWLRHSQDSVGMLSGGSRLKEVTMGM